MATGTDTNLFKSPLRKLVRFFQRSRDAWKSKCQDLRQRLKKAENQIRAVEKSREHWKEVAHQECRRAKQLEQELKKTSCHASCNSIPDWPRALAGATPHIP